MVSGFTFCGILNDSCGHASKVHGERGLTGGRSGTKICAAVRVSVKHETGGNSIESISLSALFDMEYVPTRQIVTLNKSQKFTGPPGNSRISKIIVQFTLISRKRVPVI